MIWLWILGVLAVLAVLLLLTRIGIQVEQKDGSLTVDACISLFRIRCFPVNKKVKKEKTTKKKDVSADKKIKQKQKIPFADVIDAIRTLWPPLKKALSRTRKGIRIHPLTMSVVIAAANDPAVGAKQYGTLHAGVWTAMPVLERLLIIPAPSIHIGIDFDSFETNLEGEIGLSARIGTLLMVGLTIAIPALRWFLRWRKQTRNSPVAGDTAIKHSAV